MVQIGRFLQVGLLLLISWIIYKKAKVTATISTA